MEKNQPRKLQKLMIRPIVSIRDNILSNIVPHLQVLLDKVSSGDLALRER